VFVVLTAMFALVAGSAALAGRDSSRAQVLDNTYTCAVFVRGGAYLLDVRAHAGTLLNGKWARLPYAGVRSGVFSGGAGNLVAWITSGKPVSTTMIDQDYDAFDVKTSGTVGIRREGCRRTSASVPLSSIGLRGGAAPPLGNKYECFVPKQVIVRVRAFVEGSAALRGGVDYQTTHVPTVEAQLAVRTLGGKPLVYADGTHSGRARLFAAKSCSPQ
jgi:hypothetical protein